MVWSSLEVVRSIPECTEWTSGVRNGQGGSRMQWKGWNAKDGVDGVERDGWSPEWDGRVGKTSETSETSEMDLWKYGI